MTGSGRCKPIWAEEDKRAGKWEGGVRITTEESERQRRELMEERERQENPSSRQRRGVSAMRKEQKEDDWETEQEGCWVCDRMGHTWFFCAS